MHSEAPASEVDRPPLEGLAHDRCVLAEVLQRPQERDAVHPLDAWAMARPEAQAEPPRGQLRQDNRLLDNHQGMAGKSWYDRRAQGDAPRLHRRGREHGRAVWADAPGGQPGGPNPEVIRLADHRERL